MKSWRGFGIQPVWKLILFVPEEPGGKLISQTTAFYFTKQDVGQRFFTRPREWQNLPKKKKLFRKRKSRDRPCPTQSLFVSSGPIWELLLGVCDLHGAGRRDSEALQGVFSHARLSCFEIEDLTQTLCFFSSVFVLFSSNVAASRWFPFRFILIEDSLWDLWGVNWSVGQRAVWCIYSIVSAPSRLSKTKPVGGNSLNAGLSSLRLEQSKALMSLRGNLAGRQSIIINIKYNNE